eukprot:UN11229
MEEWSRYTTNDGRSYFYNNHTGVSTWDAPSNVYDGNDNPGYGNDNSG